MGTQLKPGPHHPIAIEPLGRRVSVKVGGMIVAQSDDALLQRKSSYPLAIYIPRKDAKMERGAFGRAIVDRLHCVGGIDDQIENDLLKLHAIAFDVRQ